MDVATALYVVMGGAAVVAVLCGYGYFLYSAGATVGALLFIGTVCALFVVPWLAALIVAVMGVVGVFQMTAADAATGAAR